MSYTTCNQSPSNSITPPLNRSLMRPLSTSYLSKLYTITHLCQQEHADTNFLLKKQFTKKKKIMKKKPCAFLLKIFEKILLVPPIHSLNILYQKIILKKVKYYNFQCIKYIIFFFFLRKMLTCALWTQHKDLKIELNYK